MENKPQLYRVAGIEKTEPPDEQSGEWYSYVIEHDTTTINGKCAGTLESVTRHVEEYVDKLNSRPYLGYSGYAARSVKK